MVSFRSLTIGKGLRERSTPYHETYVFGAEFNTVNTDGWLAPLDIWDPTSNFDLSTISENHEVVVALLNVYQASQQTGQVSWRWYRDRDNALIFETSFNLLWAVAGIYSYYSYIGWHDTEISENGAYHVDIQVTGETPFSKRIDFTVSGILEVPVEPPLTSGFMADIVHTSNSVALFFFNAFLTTASWTWPFNAIASVMFEISLAFNSLSWSFYDFSLWVDTVAGKVVNILSWETIWSYILSYVPNLTQLRDWFYSWVTNVTNTVNSWWSATSVTVQGWIAAAVQPFNTMLTAWSSFWGTTWPQFTSSFNGVKSAWDNFWSYTLPKLVSFGWLGTWWSSRLLEVQGLINSAFVTREQFWAGWQDWRGKVAEFFTDPLGWLESKFTDWFLGPEV